MRRTDEPVVTETEAPEAAEPIQGETPGPDAAARLKAAMAELLEEAGEADGKAAATIVFRHTAEWARGTFAIGDNAARVLLALAE